MQANEDDEYSHEVARRAVARAALHLGVDSMSEEALDVLGDVLLTYLQRVGKVLSSMVESSNRTSAHVNILDALQAVDMCTSPAVNRLHQKGEVATNGGATPTTGWQGLAGFLFGPDWMQTTAAEVQPTAGGKVGPSSVRKQETGWEAPYLDEIPEYPLASPACANPHALPRHAALSLHGAETEDSNQKEEEKIKAIPDNVFLTDWGAVDDTKKDASKKKKAEEEPEEAPPAKRVKLADGDKAAGIKAERGGKASKKDRETKPSRPSYVPSFLPPFPSSGPGRAIVAEDHHDVSTPLVPAAATATAATATSSSANGGASQGVRSSLVQMDQQQYWGSGWDAPPPAGSIKVPSGRAKTDSTTATPPSAVVPLGKASGSRTSRIIEGSMETNQ